MTFVTRRRLLAAAIILISILVDRITKLIAVKELRGDPTRSYWGDTFRLVYAENAGAFLGMGGTLNDGLRFWLFTVVVGGLLVAAVVYLFLKAATFTTPILVAGALVLSGGLSNWADRVMNDGRVVDFMNLGIGGLRTGIFNVADIAIMAALPLVLFSPKPPKPTPNSETKAPPKVDQGPPA